MSARIFFDTNVLLYLLGSDAQKAQLAGAALEQGGVLSVQVLNEFANVARRKAGLDWTEIREALDVLKQVLAVLPLDLAIHERGLAISERYGFSLYDGLIVAAALVSDCETLLSEDMQDGQIIDQLTIRNPFRA